MGLLSWGLDLAGFELENVQMLWSAFVAQIVRQIRVRAHACTLFSLRLPTQSCLVCSVLMSCVPACCCGTAEATSQQWR
jgi:hypothetical protein